MELFLANSMAISERAFLYVQECSSSFRLMEWRKIMHIKIHPFYGNTTHSHWSVFHSHSNRRHCRVWRKQNEEYHAKCIQATIKSPVEVCKSVKPLAVDTTVHLSSEKSEW